MTKFELKFPLLGGGRPKGVNSSGIATFKGDVAENLAREWTQNAIDAHHNSWPIEMKFKRIEIPKEQLPCFDKLHEAIIASSEYWPEQQQEQDFCERALAHIENYIPVLVVSDYGTTGLRGKDDDKGQWFGLVESTETSVGDENRLGSYGIGKNAAFAASYFQTIYFSTHSIDDDFAFKGVSVLMTHKNAQGEETQPDGAIGVYDNERGKICSLRKPGEIPKRFTRKEPGLSTYIPGYKPLYRKHSHWKHELATNILANFWPAIHFQKAFFKVDDEIIEKDTLSNLMSYYADTEAKFNAHLYYRVFSSANKRIFRDTLKYLGDVILYAVREDEIEEMPNDVVLTRQNGMIIKHEKFRGLGFPFAGLLTCENEKGNKILREMEPPQHNDLHPKQLVSLDVDGDKVLEELHKWIRNQLLEFKPKLDKPEYDLPHIARYFPMPEEEDEPFEKDGDVQNENIDKATPVKEVELNSIKPFTLSSYKGTDETPGGVGDNDGTERDPKGEGDNEKTGGESHTSSGERGRLKDTEVRSFFLKEGTYRLVLRAKESFVGNVRFYASGDSVKKEPLKVNHAEDGKQQQVSIKNGYLSGIKFSEDVPMTFEVQMQHKDRFALEVEVYSET